MSTEEQLYWAALEYQKKLREIESYKSVMTLSEKRYDGWWADLASDVICLKRLARERYRFHTDMIKKGGSDV